MATTVSEKVLHAPTPVARRSPVWVVVLGVVIGLIAGFAAGVLAQQAVEDETQGLASTAAVEVVDNLIAVTNGSDPAAVADAYTDDAVFVISDSTGAVYGRYVGGDEIAAEMGSTIELRRTGEVLQQDDMVTMTYSENITSGVMTLDIVGGKIAAQWVMIETFK